MHIFRLEMKFMDDDGDMAEMYLPEKKSLSTTVSCLLFQLKEYIDDTEDFINIQLENVRNQLIQFELLLNRNICGCHLWSGSRNIRDEF
ncbi:hypothetical protein JHK87_040962 [Glycine soja]|nr:hypothetical protein JHK87_040962 [Glycine soja]